MKAERDPEQAENRDVARSGSSRSSQAAALACGGTRGNKLHSLLLFLLFAFLGVRAIVVVVEGGLDVFSALAVASDVVRKFLRG